MAMHATGNLTRSHQLSKEQKIFLLEQFIAGYSPESIRTSFSKHEDWGDPPSDRYLKQIRLRYQPIIDQRIAEQTEYAIRHGLALRGERIRRLSNLADALEPMMLVPSGRGQYPLIPQYRGILNDIALEMGDRKTGAGIQINNETTNNLVIDAEKIHEIRQKLSDWRTDRFSPLPSPPEQDVVVDADYDSTGE